METMKWQQHMAGMASMLFGLILVFGLILMMNHYMGKIEKSPPQEVTEISLSLIHISEPTRPY